MEPMVILAIVIAVAVVGWIAFQAQRTQRLRARSGGGRAVAELGSRYVETDLVAKPSSGRASLEREVPAPVQRADTPIDSARTSRRLRDMDQEVRP